MAEPEIALNLWYVRDDDGLIYSLRIRAYVCEGNDEEILCFLKDRARLDYLIAAPFPVPEAFHLTVVADGQGVNCAVTHIDMLDLAHPLPMFESALKVIEEAFPEQTRLYVPTDVLVCVTALRESPDGEIEPWITSEEKF